MRIRCNARQCAMAILIFAIASSAFSATDLPIRQAPRPTTTDSVPHVQIGVRPVPELSSELLRRVDAFPDVEVRPTIISLPGAKGFWVSNDLDLLRPDVIVRGRDLRTCTRMEACTPRCPRSWRANRLRRDGRCFTRGRRCDPGGKDSL